MDLKPLFQPASIAVIGVSHESNKVGYLVADNMLKQGFKGALSFVNPKGGSILGKEVLTSISALPEGVDLAVLAVPAHIALASIDELNAKGIKNVVLFAAGFKEVGDSGQENEKQLLEKCKAYNINLLGPNCIGYVNTKLGVNATFLKSIAPRGNVGFVSQSGALGSVMVDDFVGRQNIGFSYFISMGNKSIVDESDILTFLADDEDTAVIALYLEDVKDGDKFKKTLKSVTARKPVIILKSGTTDEGSKAALSHTGGLAGNDAVFTAVFEQNGAIRADDYTEFVTVLNLFSFGRVPTSPRVLVLSNAGGVGVLLTDQLIHLGLSLVTISEENKKELTKVFGPSKKISIHNPIDILGDASAFDYEKAISSTLDEKDIGSIIVLLTPQANTQIMETAKVIEQAQQRFERPIYPVFMGRGSVKEAHKYFESKMVASFRDHDYLTRAIAKAVEYKKYVSDHAGAIPHYPEAHDDAEVATKRTRIQEIIQSGKESQRPFLDLQESLEILSLMNIPVAPFEHVATEETLAPVLEKIGLPVTIKLSSKTITHKTEVKGVYPGLSSPEAAIDAFRAIMGNPSAEADGVYVQKQISGNELFIGALRDPGFGVVVLCGIGGIYAELFKDVSRRVFPFTQNEVIMMLKETKVYTLLSGFRGAPAADIGALYPVLYSVGQLVAEHPEISSIDLNPVFINQDGVMSVDARIILT